MEKITVGEVGELIAADAGRFKDKKGKSFDLPLEMADNAMIGSLIRITGFTADKAMCILNPDQRRTIQCEKCGYEMALSLGRFCRAGGKSNLTNHQSLVTNHGFSQTHRHKVLSPMLPSAHAPSLLFDDSPFRDLTAPCVLCPAY